jgi:membrane protein YdbS with pleckstrin-like domain
MEQETEFKQITFLRSRKAFLIEYFCAGILLIFLILAYAFSLMLKDYVLYVLVALIIIFIATAELSRIMLRYNILEDKLVTIEGLVKQNKKNIYFHPLGFVPDINVKQSRLQRILGIGTISVTMGGEHFQIKDIDYPQRIIDLIEERIEASKHPERKRE